MTRAIRAVVLGLLFVYTMAFVACSRGPTFGEVEGTVTLNGKPLDNVMVQFLPDHEKGTRGPRSTAMTEADGHYTLMSDDQHPGAIVGHHSVYIWDLLTVETMYEREHEDEIHANPKLRPKRPVRPFKIPPQYSPSGKTPLHFEVKPGQQRIDLKLTAGR